MCKTTRWKVGRFESYNGIGKKKVTEGDGDLKVIMLLAKKVMEGD